MEDQQNDENVRCESGIENELSNYLALHVVTHDELVYELKSHEQNDTEQVKLREDCVAEVCAAISEYNQNATGSGVIHPKMLN